MKLSQAFEGWFLTLALIAFTTTGIVPILLPLELIQVEGNTLHVGLVMSAMGAGMLSSPLFGTLAERFRLHRWLISLSALTTGASMLAFCFANQLIQWLVLSFLLGCSVAGAFTTGNLLIVSRHPPAECDERIGWMQTLVSAGTVLGLAAAGSVSHLPLEVGFRIAAITSVVAAGIALFSATPPPQVQASARSLSGRPGGGPGRPLLILLAGWFLANLGLFGFATFYPLVMNREFAADVDDAAYVLAAATVVSTLLFVRASSMTQRFGARRVLLGSLLFRLLLLIALAGLALTDQLPHRDWLALLCYFALTVTWPLLSVSSLVLVSQFASNKGQGLGLYDGITASGHLAGPVLCGQFAQHFGYDSVVLLSLLGVALGLTLLGLLSRPPEQTCAPVPG